MPKLYGLYHRRMLNPARIGQRLMRTQIGSQMTEFAAGLVLLITVAFVPLLDLAIVPVRWMMAQELLNSYVRTLSMCESFSEARHAMESDPSLQTRLLRLGGIGVKAINLHLKITRVSHDPSAAESIEVDRPGRIPAGWLPDGALAPCMYLLRTDIQATIAPAILMSWPGMSIPGLTEPVPLSLTASHEWLNLGRDPSNEKYFINE